MNKNKIPVLVGIAQLVRREKTVAQLDPLQMMAEASQAAVRDATLCDLAKVDTLYMVNCLSKNLSEPVRDLSNLLGIRPVETGYTGIGATAPQWFVNRAAERIFSGKSEMVLICGAEAFYTHEKIQSMAQTLDDYSVDDPSSRHSRFVGDVRRPLTNLEMHYGLVLPVAMYAIFENALRAHWKKSMSDHFEELSSFCANMSEIAARNPFSWSQKARSAGGVAAVEGENRMIVYPYTKWMCSNMIVNQAAAVVMTNLAKAETMGIPKGKMVFLRGCGDAEDVFLVSERPQLWASPSVADAVNLAIGQVPVSLDEVEYLDLYSCFPSAPRIVREMLQISPEDPRSLTVTGGMACFGGAGNNYSLHAICQMVEILRQNPEAFGLVQALSWFISKHSVGIYSSNPGKTLWTPHDSQKKTTPYPRVNVVKEAAGKGMVESYIVVYGREGQPNAATVLGRDENGSRFLARVRPEGGVIEQMTREEPIGRFGKVEHDTSTLTNWFYFQ
jgi:acetyl-CoA C-acetyltransferase